MSSPRVAQVESADLSWSSTPATNFSLGSDYGEAAHLGPAAQKDDPPARNDDAGYFGRFEDLDPPQSPQVGDSTASSPNDPGDSAATSRPGSPEFFERAEDDIAIRAQPTRHVDYLSHNWREEDIWSSWKHIVARRGDYSNAARLENASWRTWMKSKNKLKTISPEALNWYVILPRPSSFFVLTVCLTRHRLKDCDVTWLYGPLQTGTSTLNQTSASSNSTRLSKSNSFINKKPILKKRSMSEIMLQRSLSTSSLVKQAAAAVQAQRKEGMKRIGKRPGLERANTDCVTFPFSSRGLSRDGTSLFPSTRSSGVVSPSGERKHIHFNEQVSQCIAVDIKGDDDDDDDDDDADRDPYDSDSDDGGVVMKSVRPKKRRPILKKAKSRSNNGENKTIAMLPSTKLKYREDTPEPTESAMKHSTNAFRSPVLSPSSSQETLRPSKKSGKLFIAGDDDDDDDDDDQKVDSRAGTGDSRTFSSTRHGGEGGFGLRRTLSSSSLSASLSASLSVEPAGMRRTESGMFMPFEEGQSRAPSDNSLISRIIDTVNTARDIAYVIWNVGWRR